MSTNLTPEEIQATKEFKDWVEAQLFERAKVIRNKVLLPALKDVPWNKASDVIEEVLETKIGHLTRVQYIAARTALEVRYPIEMGVSPRRRY